MYKIIGADRKEYGPINAGQLRQWIAEGRINGGTQIQAEGGPWKNASEFPEFAAALASIAPPSHTAPIYLAPPAPAQKANLTAVWSLIVGIVSIVPCCFGILGVVSIVLGCVALSQISQNPQQGGRGFAIAGIVLGVISLLMIIAGTMIFYAFPQLRNSLQTPF